MLNYQRVIPLAGISKIFQVEAQILLFHSDVWEHEQGV